MLNTVCLIQQDELRTKAQAQASQRLQTEAKLGTAQSPLCILQMAKTFASRAPDRSPSARLWGNACGGALAPYVAVHTTLRRVPAKCGAGKSLGAHAVGFLDFFCFTGIGSPPASLGAGSWDLSVASCFTGLRDFLGFMAAPDPAPICFFPSLSEAAPSSANSTAFACV